MGRDAARLRFGCRGHRPGSVLEAETTETTDRRGPLHARTRGGILVLPDAALGALAVLASLAIYVARRPDQLLHPYVWDEESNVLQSFAAHGWAAATGPVNGYLDLPGSPLITSAASISFVHLPRIEYAFALGVFLVTVLLLVVPASIWGGVRQRALMALAMVLVPTGPEVFGVLLYSFWWATLWPLIILGWTTSRWGLRAPLLAIAALSSPAGGALFIVYAVAYARRRERRDLVGGVILLAGFLVQVGFVETSARGPKVGHQAARLVTVGEQMLRSGGLYLLGSLGPRNDSLDLLLVTGAVLAVVLAAGAIWAATSARAFAPALLVLAAVVLTLLSSIPHPLITGPRAAAPRYFFLPFVVITWTLISLAGLMLERRRAWAMAAAVAGLIVVVSLIDLPATFFPARLSEAGKLSWPHELRLCASGDLPQGVPIYYDGTATRLWRLHLSARQCSAYLGSSSLGSESVSGTSASSSRNG